MTIKRYFLGQKDVLTAKAINDIMVLFGVCADNSDILDDDVKSLPNDAVLVKNRIEQYPDIKVRTEVVFWSNNETIEVELQEKVSENKDNSYEHLIKQNVLAAMRNITGCDPGPWGILRGVRPTKIVHRLLDQGMSPNKIEAVIANDYSVTKSKAKLLTGVALRQRQFIDHNQVAPQNISIYIGIPFCPSRCLYCSFPAYALPTGEKITSFLHALEKDMNAASEIIKRFNLVVKNIYIGGGTPTSLNNEQFNWLLARVSSCFIAHEIDEFTVEAGRPDSITKEKIAVMHHYGVSRVSVNPQTMQQKTLNLIGRNHTIEDIIDVFGKIRQSGIPIINMDVIAGLPGEEEQDIADTFAKIKVLDPDNVTVHTLAVKKGSMLKNESIDYLNQAVQNGEKIQRMLNIADQCTREMHMYPYYLYRQKYMMGNLENIGYAKPGTECRYNIQIMEERQTIIGIGPAAGTKAVNTLNWTLKSCYNAKDLTSYINNLDKYVGMRNRLLAALFADNEEE